MGDTQFQGGYQHDKMCELRRACGSDGSLSNRDQSFAQSLCEQYFSRGTLSEKQWYWVGELLKKAGAMPTASGSSQNNIQEIFDGKAIKELLNKASLALKRPKLRYQTDGGSKIVLSYVAEASKWAGCTFIDNGGKENKKRYGFIDRNGNGRINRDAPPDIKDLIKKIAGDPVNVAKLSGQKYSNCCFCGLELVNKSSVYHGYGPICAEKWGLPWGDTGDLADEEAAAQAELKHIELVDLGENEPVVKHYPNCSPNYPEKVPGEAPQQLQEIEVDPVTIQVVCVDCGAYALKAKKQS